MKVDEYFFGHLAKVVKADGSRYADSNFRECFENKQGLVVILHSSADTDKKLFFLYPYENPLSKGYIHSSAGTLKKNGVEYVIKTAESIYHLINDEDVERCEDEVRAAWAVKIMSGRFGETITLPGKEKAEDKETVKEDSGQDRKDDEPGAFPSIEEDMASIEDTDEKDGPDDSKKKKQNGNRRRRRRNKDKDRNKGEKGDTGSGR